MMPFAELQNWDDLQPGDILLFLPWHLQKVPFTTKVIMLAQSLYYAREGYYPVTHAAIYLKKVGSQHQLVHVAEEGYRYRKDSLEEIEQTDKEKRPFIVFRPRAPQIATKIALTAESAGYQFEQEKKSIKWSFFSAASSLTRRSAVPLNHTYKLEQCKITEKTHCSKFAVQCIRTAALQAAMPKYVLNIHSTVTPAGFFKALFTNGNYQPLTYLAGIDPYAELQTEITKHLHRIGSRSDHSSREKYKLCMTHLAEVKKQISKMSGSNIEKCVSMMQELLPFLALHTSFSLYQEALSARELREWARKKGIFDGELQSSKLKLSM